MKDRCDTIRCKFQLGFYSIDKMLSSVNKRTQGFVVPPRTIYITCHSYNGVYHITYDKCQIADNMLLSNNM